MKKARMGMVIGSVLGVFILVYGTAVLFRFVFGSYLFAGGIADLKYAVLAAGCAAPFVLSAFLGRRRAATEHAEIISAVLFGILFAAVHAALTFSGEAAEAAAAVRVLFVFPLTALILLLVLRLAAGREREV